MAKQMYATVLVVANLETKPLPTSLLNALEVEAHNLAKPRERNIGNTVKLDANLSVRRIELLHHKFDVAPLVAKLILATTEVTKRVDATEMKKRTTRDDSCDLLESLKLRNLDVVCLGGHGVVERPNDQAQRRQPDSAAPSEQKGNKLP